MNNTSHWSVVLLVAATVLSSCGLVVGNPPKPATDDKGSITPEPPAAVCVGKHTALPSVATGVYTFDVAKTTDPCSVEGYIVGKAGIFKIERGVDGRFLLDALPPGKHDVVITATDRLDAPLGLAGEPQKRGVRLGVEIFAQKVTDGGELALPKVSSIAGKVRLAGREDHAGIDVYIPGTSYAAKTASDGSFKMGDVPAGKHSIYMDHDGFHRGRFETLAVDSARETTLPDATLLVATGAAGSIRINDGEMIVDSLSVALTIAATPEAILMKISESDAFLGAEWVPISASTTYRFSSEGAKTLYVKFADANGLESSPYSAQTEVDLFPAADIGIAPVNGLVIPPADPVFEFVIRLATNATDMSVTWEGSPEVWISAATSATLALPKSPASCGFHAVALKLRDVEGSISETTTNSVEVRCSEAVPHYYGVAGAAMDDRLFMLTNENLASTYRPGDSSWSPVAQPPAPPSKAAVAWTGQKIVIAGGQVDSLTSNQKILTYDPVADTWSTLTPQNTFDGRSAPCAVWIGMKLIVWGGHRSQGAAAGPASDGAAYDFTTNSWAALSNDGAPYGGARPKCFWSGTEMVVFGVSSDGVRRAGGAYEPNSDSWRTLATPPYFFGIHQAGAWDGTLFVHYERSESTTLPRLMAYDPRNDTWRVDEALPPIPFQLNGAGVGLFLRNRLFLFDASSSLSVIPRPYAVP